MPERLYNFVFCVTPLELNQCDAKRRVRQHYARSQESELAIISRVKCLTSVMDAGGRSQVHRVASVSSRQVSSSTRMLYLPPAIIDKFIAKGKRGLSNIE